jgi:hypothetical protein
MDKNLRGKTVFYFTIPTALLVIVTSVGGLSFGSTYSRETFEWLGQAIGQDLVDLVLLVPTLLVSALFVAMGKRAAMFVWLGAMMYTAYTFVIYSFGVHFNTLFLVYCWTLGLSVYAFVTLVVQIGPAVVKSWFDETRHEHVISIFVLIAGVLFYLMWLKEDLPAMILNQAPPSLQETGLLTNPVHVLDLSLILPAFILTSVLLIKKHAFGYLFAPVLLVFGILMDITIAALIIVMKIRGTEGTVALAALFIVFAIISIIVLVGFLRHMKKPALQADGNHL